MIRARTPHRSAGALLRALLLALSTALSAAALPAFADGPVSVTDRRGPQSFEAPPTRIVVLDWALAEALLDLGIAPLGAPELTLYRDWVGTPAMPEGVTDIGLRSAPNLETIASLEPQAIVAADLSAQEVARLEAIAPVLVFDAWSADHDNLAAQREIFLELALLTGRTARAERLLSEMETEITRRAEALARAYAGTPPDTAVIRLNDAATLWVYGENAVPTAALEALGVANALPQPPSRWGVAQKNLDALAEVEQGAIIAIRPHMAGAQVFESPLWQNLPAVAAGRYAEAGPVWSYGGYLSLLRHARALSDALLALAE
ncbi:iron-siderophore ABC transporter substrate-binding protein [Roseivivax sp.]